MAAKTAPVREMALKLDNPDDEANKPAPVPTSTLQQMLSTADDSDKLNMILGTFGGVITGMSLPFFNVIFGRILDQLNKNPGDKGKFSDGVNTVQCK